MSMDIKKKTLKVKDDKIVENLDNTASFKTILSSVDDKSRKEKTLINFINYTVKRKRKCKTGEVMYLSDFLLASQPRNVFKNEWDGSVNSGFFEDCPLRSLMPWMISKWNNVDKADPLIDAVTKRVDWNTAWNCIKSSYLKTKNRRKKHYKWFDDDVLYCPKVFTHAAAHLENVPDKFFDDSYNWYYAGEGNMHVTHWQGMDLIIQSQLNYLYVSRFYKENLSIDYANSASYVCKENMYINETIISRDMVVLRTRCKIIILKLHLLENQIQLQHVKDMDSELPFTSISIDTFHNNILYVTTLDYQLSIINMDRMTKRSVKLQGKFESLTNNWSRVIGSERNCYTHVTNKALTLYDKRTHKPFQRLKSFPFISDNVLCTKISATKYCPDKPLLYAATNHHLFLLDMRCSNTKDDNIKPVQRWTHGMISSPTYISINEYDTDYHREIVCLSSQWFEDMCIASNYSDTMTRPGDIPGLDIPYRPPSVLQTYHAAQNKNLCCNIHDQLRSRLCTSISGMAIVKREDNQCILMQNSLGDISCHVLYSRHMLAFLEEDSAERLDEWCKSYPTPKNKFAVSYIVDVGPIWRRLKQVPDNHILEMSTNIPQNHKFNEDDIYNINTKEELDPEILEVWKEHNEEISIDYTQNSMFFVDTS